MPPVGAQNLDNRFRESVYVIYQPNRQGDICDEGFSQLCIFRFEIFELVVVVFAADV
jgi:hypothetical protein